MECSRSIAIGLAKASCPDCLGHGTRIFHKRSEVTCDCVFRAIFNACYNRFRECVALAPHTNTVSIEFSSSGTGKRVFSRKCEEYAADFCLVSRRVLTDEEFRFFRYRFLLGASPRLCRRAMLLDGTAPTRLAHRVRTKLGRAFVELEPYPLFPLDEYFGGTVRRGPCLPSIPSEPAPTRQSLAERVPMMEIEEAA